MTLQNQALIQPHEAVLNFCTFYFISAVYFFIKKYACKKVQILNIW